MGLPALAVPGLRDADGLPLGLQLIGHPDREDALLAAGRRLESLLLVSDLHGYRREYRSHGVGHVPCTALRAGEEWGPWRTGRRGRRARRPPGRRVSRPLTPPATRRTPTTSSTSSSSRSSPTSSTTTTSGTATASATSSAPTRRCSPRASPRWVRYVPRAHPAGFVLGTAFGLISLTPSLIPRDYLFQGLATGISAALGYAIGVALAWLLRRMARWTHLTDRLDRATPVWLTPGRGWCSWSPRRCPVRCCSSPAPGWQRQIAGLMGIAQTDHRRLAARRTDRAGRRRRARRIRARRAVARGPGRARCCAGASTCRAGSRPSPAPCSCCSSSSSCSTPGPARRAPPGRLGLRRHERRALPRARRPRPRRCAPARPTSLVRWDDARARGPGLRRGRPPARPSSPPRRGAPRSSRSAPTSACSPRPGPSSAPRWPSPSSSAPARSTAPCSPSSPPRAPAGSTTPTADSLEMVVGRGHGDRRHPVLVPAELAVVRRRPHARRGRGPGPVRRRARPASSRCPRTGGRACSRSARASAPRAPRPPSRVSRTPAPRPTGCSGWARRTPTGCTRALTARRDPGSPAILPVVGGGREVRFGATPDDLARPPGPWDAPTDRLPAARLGPGGLVVPVRCSWRRPDVAAPSRGPRRLAHHVLVPAW